METSRQAFKSIYDGTSFRLSRRGWIVTWGLVALALVPTLLYVLGGDGALFFVGARKVLDGAVYYRDFIDTKPPLIAYLYATAIGIFGPYEISIRILDVLLQGITCWMIATFVRRISKNDLWGAAAAVCYAVAYTAQGRINVAQTESYIGLLGIPILWLLMRRPGLGGYFGIGVLGGLLFLFKFTFAALLGVAFFAEIIVFRESWRKIVWNYAVIAVGFVSVLALWGTYLVLSGSLEDFLVVYRFTQKYAGLQWSNKGEFVRNTLKLVPAYLSDNYSVLLAIATVTGIACSIPLRARPSTDSRSTTGTVDLLRLATIAFVLMLATIVLEGKFAPYQFGRLYPFGAILAAFGGLLLAATALRAGIGDSYGRAIVAVAFPVLLLLSPLPRYARHALLPVVGVMRGDPLLGDAFRDERQEAARVGEYIRNNRHGEDGTFVLSYTGSLVYLFAEEIPRHRIFYSMFIIAPFAPPEWKDSMSAYLVTSRPRFIVTQRHDAIPGIAGSDVSSDVALRGLPGVDSLLNTDYRLVMHTEPTGFELYERTDSTTAR